MKRLPILSRFILAFIFFLIILALPKQVIAQNDIVQVTANSGLNLRQGPGTQYSVIRVLGNGSRWYVFGSSENWLALGANKWISGIYTKPSYPVKIVKTTAYSGLNVRLGPGTGYSKIKTLPLNTIAEVLEEKYGWYRISNEGWIYGYYTKPLDNATYGWYYIPNSSHETPEVSKALDISRYGGYYIGDTSGKKIYLTFDLGYEAGYTPTILDTLKQNDVKAAFFVSKYFIDNNPELVKRMVNEGHIVGNHTDTHPSLPSIATDISEFNRQLTSVEAAYNKITGKEMPKVMRPPMGDYSELSLYLTNRLGYRTFFWSFGYYDYDTENQPEKTYAYNKITGGTHNGAIILLHGVSKTNTEILDSVIKNIRDQGYVFYKIDTLQ